MLSPKLSQWRNHRLYVRNGKSHWWLWVKPRKTTVGKSHLVYTVCKSMENRQSSWLCWGTICSWHWLKSTGNQNHAGLSGAHSIMSGWFDRLTVSGDHRGTSNSKIFVHNIIHNLFGFPLVLVQEWSLSLQRMSKKKVKKITFVLVC